MNFPFLILCQLLIELERAVSACDRDMGDLHSQNIKVSVFADSAIVETVVRIC